MSNKFSLLAIFSFVALLLSPSVANAQTDDDESTITNDDYNPIPTSVQMLNIGPEGRGTGMGDAGVATTPDIGAQYWNPAKYVRMDSKAGAMLSITPWLRHIISLISLLTSLRSKSIGSLFLCGCMKMQ